MENTNLVIPELNENLPSIIKEIEENPAAFGEIIKQINDGLEKSKTDAERIKNRNLLKRMVSSNTKDIASIIIEQNKVMMGFYLILQIVTTSCKANSLLMFKLIESLNNNDSTSNVETDNLIGFAKSYMTKAIQEEETEKLRDSALKKLLINTATLNEFKSQSEDELKKISMDITQMNEHINRINSNLSLHIDNKSFFDSIAYKIIIGVIAVSSFIFCLLTYL